MQNSDKWSHRGFRLFLPGIVMLAFGFAWYGASTTAADDKGSSANGDNSSKAMPTAVAASNDELLVEEDSPNAQYRELTGFTFYIDPGHGGLNPPGQPCQDFGATGPNGTFEKDWSLQIAYTLPNRLSLGPILEDHGARVFYTRTTDETVCARLRWEANNRDYRALGGMPSNWRFISIHLNGNDNITNTNKTEIYRNLSAHQHALDLSNVAKEWIGREVFASPANRVSLTGDLWAVRETEPQYYNILTESNYLANNVAFENRLRFESGFVAKLAYAHYRSLVDFWLVGYEGPHQTPHPQIISEYNNSIAAGKDPGVPFNNGSTYYAHTYPGDGRAWTQEFKAPNGLLGSILQCKTAPCPPTSGSGAYYVRGPVWSTYIEKNGPNNNGPGLPWGVDGHEHSWTTVRGVRNNVFTYPQTQNFENGAIYWNSFEGSISDTNASHAVFLPNCRAGDINDNWAAGYLRNMIGRFALSNDRPGPNPLPTPLARYDDGKVHPNDLTTRAQLAQSLMFAEGYLYAPNNQNFGDVLNHWGRPWVKMAGSRGIISGYTCGGPGEPCDPNNNPYFRPDNFATRAQFSKMLSVARVWTLLNPTPLSGRVSVACPASSGGYYSFSDVCYNLGDLYKGVETAKSYGIIDGYGTNECNSNAPAPCFKPGNNLTRAQMSKMIDLALTNSGYSPGPCWGEPTQ